jgi:hypothetical protein
MHNVLYLNRNLKHGRADTLMSLTMSTNVLYVMLINKPWFINQTYSFNVI